MNNTVTNVIMQKSENTSYRNFVELHGYFYNDLCNFTFKYGFKKESAEEIVSNVFLKIWKKQGLLNFDKSIRSYLYTSVKNQCIDYLRKSNKPFLPYNYYSENAVATHSNPEDDFIYRELWEKANLAIESLPPECEKIFRMSRFHGLKYKEIAQKLDISIKTVEAQISKALKRLRVQLCN
jgi:RNA polymerase sigma-70 factor (ECF subfamily)